MNHQQKSEKDELRARFTKWLETTVYRARIDYIRRNAGDCETLSLEDVPEEVLAVDHNEDSWIRDSEGKDAFDFEEERLAKAFRELPLMRRKILTMLFVQEKKPEEIAAALHCSVQHVYNQRSLAIGKLRAMLEKGGDMK